MKLSSIITVVGVREGFGPDKQLSCKVGIADGFEHTAAGFPHKRFNGQSLAITKPTYICRPLKHVLTKSKHKQVFKNRFVVIQ